MKFPSLSVKTVLIVAALLLLSPTVSLAQTAENSGGEYVCIDGDEKDAQVFWNDPQARIIYVTSVYVIICIETIKLLGPKASDTFAETAEAMGSQ